MNAIFSKLLLQENKFIPEFAYSAFVPFTNSKGKIREFKEKEILDISIRTK